MTPRPKLPSVQTYTWAVSVLVTYSGLVSISTAIGSPERQVRGSLAISILSALFMNSIRVDGIRPRSVVLHSCRHEVAHWKSCHFHSPQYYMYVLQTTTQSTAHLITIYYFLSKSSNYKIAEVLCWFKNEHNLRNFIVIEFLLQYCSWTSDYWGNKVGSLAKSMTWKEVSTYLSCLSTKINSCRVLQTGCSISYFTLLMLVSKQVSHGIK